jgi:hypothetical protein
LQLLERQQQELVFQQQQPWSQTEQQVESDQIEEPDMLPAGPVFDTSMPGAMWVEAAAAAEAAAEAAAAEAAAAEAAEEAAAAAAAAEAAALAEAAGLTQAAAGLAAADVAAAGGTQDATAIGTSSSNGVVPVHSAATAAPGVAPPGAAPASSRTSLGSIHERVERLEQEHEQQKQKQQKQQSRVQKQAMKPRATGEPTWSLELILVPHCKHPPFTAAAAPHTPCPTRILWADLVWRMHLHCPLVLHSAQATPCHHQPSCAAHCPLVLHSAQATPCHHQPAGHCFRVG